MKPTENNIFVIHNHEVAGSCPALATDNQKVAS